MKIVATDFIAYEVADMARSLAFYRDTLGLKLLTPNPDGWAEFDVPPLTLCLDSSPPHDPPKTGGGYIALAVDDFEGALAELRSKGVDVIEGPWESPFCHQAYIADPDGNTVCIHWRKNGTAG